MLQYYVVANSTNLWRSIMRPAMAQVTIANIYMLAHVISAAGAGSPKLT